MYYAVTHLTIYTYSEPISDSMMEVRMQPISKGKQRCVRFNLDLSPKARTLSYKDYLGNVVHSFDIPGQHKKLAIKAESIAEIKPATLPPENLPMDTWDKLDQETWQPDRYDMLLAGHFTVNTPRLQDFMASMNWGRRTDPMTLLRELNSTIYEHFDYHQHVTKVDSPIDIALEAGGGVCQDFAHIMLTMARHVGIPARYVSGYLYHRVDQHDRSDVDASHAWVEVWLPELGWVGFDPTNNLIVTDRHIKVSTGKDYAEAPPTKGVFRGDAETDLEVRVQVIMLDELPVEETELAPEIVMPHYETMGFQEQQQQQ